MTDWCAVCGKPFAILEHGAYRQCHRGLGYVSTDVGEPEPADAWAGHKTRRGLWFFIRPGFPKR